MSRSLGFVGSFFFAADKAETKRLGLKFNTPLIVFPYPHPLVGTRVLTKINYMCLPNFLGLYM